MPDIPGSPDEPRWVPPVFPPKNPVDIPAEVGYATPTHDEANVRSTSYAPSLEQSSAAEAQPETDVEMSGVEPPVEPLPEFDPKCRDALDGLLFLGALTKTYDWNGHRFTIRTLKMDELLQVALVHARFANTIGDVKAYQAAIVSACLQLVDGKQLPIPAFVDETSLDQRFRFCTSNWYPWTFDSVYQNYLELEAKTLEVMEAMGKVLGSTVSTPG
jgi:hypothetical protein